jgi:hypothetical protein
MTSYESITKQLCINQLNLPFELINEIKEFCFYDIKSWEMMNFIKNKKRRIHDIFENATISRANPYDLYVYDENTDEQWAFWTFDEDDGPNKQFQAFNCKCCGNYKVFENDIIFHTDKIICYCVGGIDDDYNDDEEEDDHDDQFMDDDSIGV